MAEKHLLICDACGNETSLYESDGWLQLRTYISSQTFMSRVHEAREYGGDDGTNHGDFCSLNCVVNFCGTQTILRDLSLED